jgi:hypothetical protein
MCVCIYVCVTFNTLCPRLEGCSRFQMKSFSLYFVRKCSSFHDVENMLNSFLRWLPLLGLSCPASCKFSSAAQQWESYLVSAFFFVNSDLLAWKAKETLLA